MIDWVTAVVPCLHDQLVNAGRVISLDPDGEIQWMSEKKMTLRGSDESSIQIKTSMDRPHTHLFIDGNPVKFLQGHNLWGTDDLLGLMYHFLLKVTSMIGLSPSTDDIQAWANGSYELKKVDINYSWHLSSKADVLAWIRSAEQSSRLRYRGSGQLKGSTLYYGQNSRRWSLKAYSKGDEVSAKGHQLPQRLQLPHILDWADRSLRLETRLSALELKRRDLHIAANWAQNTPSEIHKELLSGLEMSDNYIIPDSDICTLPPRLRTAYIAWKDGHDLRSIYPRPTYYRYRKQLLEHGIDIANVQLREPSNVIPLIRVLEAKPVTIPDFALGTDLYFDPPKILVNSR